MRACKKHNHTQAVDKRRVLELNFSETTQSIEDCPEQECYKENISVDEVIFLFTSLVAKYYLEPKFKAEKVSLHLTEYAKRYSMKLNSLSHDIYLRVIWI